MKTFEINSDWIDRYNEDALASEERDYFEQQMRDNPVLRAEVRLDQRLDRFLQDTEIIDLMDKVRAVHRKNSSWNNRTRYMLVAAAILCLVTVGILMHFVEIREPSGQTSLRQQAVKPDKKPGDSRDKTDRSKGDILPHTAPPAVHPGIRGPLLLADNFKPMAELEQMVGSVTRSGLVGITAPGPRTHLRAGSTLQFTWVPGKSGQAVTIFLVNNRGKQVSECAGNFTGSMNLETKGLAPGLYYWKFMLNEEMVMIGKVILY